MGRPRVRTAQLSSDEVRQLKETFGTFTNAWQQLGRQLPSHTTPRAFSEVVAGRAARPSDVDAVRRALAAHRQRLRASAA